MLPFSGEVFTWKTFESFCNDFLAAGPSFQDEGEEVRVERSRLYGQEGEDQDGIDIECTMSNGQVWGFQCKYREGSKNWTASDTKKAIKKWEHPSSRNFLLISRESVGEAARKPLPEGWQLWDGREITTEFIHRLADRKQDAADVIYRHFGGGWAEQFFDIKGPNPFLGAEAFYQRLLQQDEGRMFDLRGALHGRKKDLKALHEFVDSNRRVFSLIAKGGFGKSRLLLDWARSASLHESTVLFLSEGSTDREQLVKYLDLLKGDVVIVVDDAHRREAEFGAIVAAIQSKPEIKLVLAQRPLIEKQTRRHLLQQGFDSSDISSRELKPLPHEVCRQFAEAILENKRPGLTKFIASQARSSPLMATLTAKLARSGTLGEIPLNETEGFQDQLLSKVFEPTREEFLRRFPDAQIDGLLHTLALLSPFISTEETRTWLANFLEIKEEQLSDYLERLIELGLAVRIVRSEHWSEQEQVQYRITPDILSDHLAYQATMDKFGTSRGFAERLIGEDFPEPKFRMHLLNNTAAVDWRATKNEPTVFDKMWDVFIDKFKSATEHQRAQRMSELSEIALIKPAHVLELIEWIREAGPSQVEPGGEADEVLLEELYPAEKAHRSTLSEAISRLSAIGNMHAEHVAACLDLLWQFHQEGIEPISMYSQTSSSLMASMATPQIWKDPAVVLASHDWLSAVCKEPEAMKEAKLAWLIPHVLAPAFNLTLEEMWQSGFQQLSHRDWPIPVKLGRKLRESALRFCNKRMHWPVRWQHGVLALIKTALEAPWTSVALSAAQAKAFDETRRQAASILTEIAAKTTDPVVLCRVRRLALDHVGSEVLSEPMHTLISGIEDTAELRLVRAMNRARGCDFRELAGKEEEMGYKDWSDALLARFDEFVRTTARELIETHPEPKAGLATISASILQMQQNEYHPSHLPLLNAIAEEDGAYALSMATMILSTEEHPLGEAYGWMVATANEDQPNLTAMLSTGLQSEESLIQEGCVSAVSWLWNKDRDPKGELAKLMMDFLKNPDRAAAHLSPILYRWLPLGQLDSFGKKFLGKLPSLVTTEQASTFCRRLCETYLDDPISSDQMTDLLAKLSSVPDLNASEIELARLSEVYPLALFRLLERRLGKPQKDGFRPLPLRVDSFRLGALLKNPEVRRKAEVFIRSWIKEKPVNSCNPIRLYSFLTSSTGPDSVFFFQGILANIQCAEELDQLVSFLHQSQVDLSLRNPTLLREVLVKAQELGSEPTLAKELARRQGIRGTMDGEPDKNWSSLIEFTQQLATEYADDPVLGPFYQRKADNEQKDVDQSRQSFLDASNRFQE